MKFLNVNSRKQKLIHFLASTLKPFFKVFFNFEQVVHEKLEAVPTLYVSNHNIGALVESHSILFLADEAFTNSHVIYGFTHPSIFKIPFIKHYFEWLGAVPATYEVAREVFLNGQSLLIFPGGNKQALRSVWDYKQNSFREVHGWAKIAIENQVDVVPITFKGSHFVNPVLFQSSMLSKILVIPWALGLRWLSVSIAQVLLSLLAFWILQSLQLSLLIIAPAVIFIFCLTSLTILFPSPIRMEVHKRIRIKNLTQSELEDRVGTIMDKIYEN